LTTENINYNGWKDTRCKIVGTFLMCNKDNSKRAYFNKACV